MRRMTLLTPALSGVLMCLASLAQAAEWGDLAARLVLDGPPPAPKPANVNKDLNFCGQHKVVDETLVVNSKNGGIADVVVFLYLSRGTKLTAIHPDYDSTKDAEVKLDNSKCRFEPHVAVLRTSQTLLVGNSDAVGHNTNVTALNPANASQNVLIPAGGVARMKFPYDERFPLPVACNIHPWMHALVVVKDHPYAAATDRDGKLLIKNLPVGTWTFQFWHKVPGYVREVERDGKTESWSRGRVELEIKPGQNDLGEIKLPASLFEDAP